MWASESTFENYKSKKNLFFTFFWGMVLKKYAIEKKNHSRGKKYFEIKHLQALFWGLYVKLATIQIWGQMSKFPLTCSFQKWAKRWIQMLTFKGHKSIRQFI